MSNSKSDIANSTIELLTLMKLAKLDRFGISRVQRIHRCGYNFSAQMLTRWAEEGFVKQQEKGWVFTPVVSAINDAALKAGLLEEQW